MQCPLVIKFKTMNIDKTCIVAACKNSESYVLLKEGGGYIYKQQYITHRCLELHLEEIKKKKRAR